MAEFTSLEQAEAGGGGMEPVRNPEVTLPDLITVLLDKGGIPQSGSDHLGFRYSPDWCEPPRHPGRHGDHAGIRDDA